MRNTGRQPKIRINDYHAAVHKEQRVGRQGRQQRHATGQVVWDKARLRRIRR